MALWVDQCGVEFRCGVCVGVVVLSLDEGSGCFSDKY